MPATQGCNQWHGDGEHTKWTPRIGRFQTREPWRVTCGLYDGGGAHGAVVSVVEGRVLISNLVVDPLATEVRLASEFGQWVVFWVRRAGEQEQGTGSGGGVHRSGRCSTTERRR